MTLRQYPVKQIRIQSRYIKVDLDLGFGIDKICHAKLIGIHTYNRLWVENWFEICPRKKLVFKSVLAKWANPYVYGNFVEYDTDNDLIGYLIAGGHAVPDPHGTG